MPTICITRGAGRAASFSTDYDLATIDRSYLTNDLAEKPGC